MELLYTDTLEDARRKLDAESSQLTLCTEYTDIENAVGRICAEDVCAAENIPAFPRSVVDGYAVRAEDTYGASESGPAFFRITGSVNIEEAAGCQTGPQEAVRVQTGSMVPPGASAVIMNEYGQEYGEGKLAVYRAAGTGENLIDRGEDICAGACVIPRGRKLTASDTGIMAALGIGTVCVWKKPRVTVISTGDELTGIEEMPQAGKIRDINTYILAAEAQSRGMNVIRKLREKDCEADIRNAVRSSLQDSDIILLSGGSSKGKKDYTKQIFEELSGNVFTHGIAVKPGKPTILAFDRTSRTILAGLPGHPMAALLMFRLLIADWYRERTGGKKVPPYPAVLAENVSSNQGRATCLPVRLVLCREGDLCYEALPVHAKSGSISALSRADGYVMIPRDREGMRKGEIVRVEVLS